MPSDSREEGILSGFFRGGNACSCSESHDAIRISFPSVAWMILKYSFKALRKSPYGSSLGGKSMVPSYLMAVYVVDGDWRESGIAGLVVVSMSFLFLFFFDVLDFLVVCGVLLSASLSSVGGDVSLLGVLSLPGCKLLVSSAWFLVADRSVLALKRALAGAFFRYRRRKGLLP